jgi:WhiB family redox-sensing transcriptional regulator
VTDPTTIDPEQDWRARAACRGTDPDLFFPTTGDLPWEAMAICSACPVINACLRYALTTNQEHGIWGGRSERQRRRLQRRRRGVA